jgi:hypothetical protein
MSVEVELALGLYSFIVLFFVNMNTTHYIFYSIEDSSAKKYL